ncbi:MRP-L47 domain-containing protein [Cephalotus follicularis]|uniref:Large ribosomal subunit protein uL29m n=1 Tax=Cephalotus follicularis TaxID=3775 RepID=A0A1Q3CL95_CEPFO|nr:MRP-L47 domain-containing protein [Cephalotus follicularis]
MRSHCKTPFSALHLHQKKIKIKTTKRETLNTSQTLTTHKNSQSFCIYHFDINIIVTKHPSSSNLITTMFMTRFFGRTLLTAAKSESFAATAAAASTARVAQNPLEEFFEADRSQDNDKPVVYGRSWKASELRLKSWDDLNKLWYVLLKEKNMLMTQRQMLHAQNLRFPNPERLPKVRKTMCRIKHVLTERAIEEPDRRRSAEMKKMINAL